MQVIGLPFIRRCHCGLVFRFGHWIKPDEFQTRCIAEAVNNKRLAIQEEHCPDCHPRHLVLERE